MGRLVVLGVALAPLGCFCHSQATVSFVPTRTLAFSGISGILGIQGSRASEDYTSRRDLESSKVLSRDLEVR